MFSSKPALPKQAASASDVDRTDEFTIAVQRADIIYFPVEAIGADSTEQPVWKIVEALKRSAASFSIAWQGIETDQQPLLDKIVDHSEDFFNDLRWTYTGQTREHCKSVLQATLRIPHLSLGCPRVINTKLQAGSALNGDEKAIIPRGYRTPAGGLEDFAEQLASVRDLHERDVANFYRAHLFAEQFAAEKIVNFMREHEGEKLLVFSRRRDLGGDNGVPAFVAQKLKLRQISFDLNRSSRNARPRLVVSPWASGSTLGWL